MTLGYHKIAARAMICGIAIHLFVLTPVFAQSLSNDGNLPAEISNAIKSAKITQDLFPVSENERSAQQIIKADEISFAEGAKLILTKLDVPWIVIAARRWKFAKPEAYSIIQRDPAIASAKSGAPGAFGSKGAEPLGETNRRGNDGGGGSPGGTGGPGQSQYIPTIYLIIGDILDPKGRVPAGVLNLVLAFPGIDGGNGGAGGRGGDGGRAGNGKEGADSAFGCKEGGGPGGNGGAGGPGGKGGEAGNGGPGSNIVIVTTRTSYEALSFLRINNAGGRPGTPGAGGIPGNPGSGGAGAGRNSYCDPTGAGSSGAPANPPNMGAGDSGKDGPKGSATAVILESVDDLF